MDFGQQCRDCLVPLTLENTRKKRGSSTGRDILCKSCLNKKNSFYSARRENTPRRTIQKNCHHRVAYALQTGKLKQQPCESCGATREEATIEAHHDDYAKPLEVKWFCQRCHGDHHKKYGPGKNATTESTSQEDPQTPVKKKRARPLSRLPQQPSSKTCCPCCGSTDLVLTLVEKKKNAHPCYNYGVECRCKGCGASWLDQRKSTIKRISKWKNTEPA